MASYLLKGVYVDPKTRRRTEPGHIIELSDDEAHRLRYMLTDPSVAQAEVAVVGYEHLTVNKLKAEIDDRNESRPAEQQILPVTDKKADLVAALEADDEASAGT